MTERPKLYLMRRKVSRQELLAMYERDGCLAAAEPPSTPAVSPIAYVNFGRIPGKTELQRRKLALLESLTQSRSAGVPEPLGARAADVEQEDYAMPQCTEKPTTRS